MDKRGCELLSGLQLNVGESACEQVLINLPNASKLPNNKFNRNDPNNLWVTGTGVLSASVGPGRSVELFIY
jgi:hypothetical protein